MVRIMRIKSVVISAGGQGIRMKEKLGETPKVLAQIEGTPFIQWVFDKWESLGIEHIHLLLGYKSLEIWNSSQEWLLKKENRKNKIKLSATIEPYPVGVGGALMLAKGFLSEPFIFTYGDVYPTVDVKQLCDNFTDESDGCMAVCSSEIACEPGNVKIENGYISCYDKSNKELDYVDVGAMILRPEVLSGNNGFKIINGEELLKIAISRGKFKAFMHNAASKHIGDPDAYNNFVSWVMKIGG